MTRHGLRRLKHADRWGYGLRHLLEHGLSYCPAPSGSWNLAQAQPFSGITPPPGLQLIFGNPTQSQREWTVHVHRKRYGDRKKIGDDRWIVDVGQKNWRIITSDKNLESRYHDAIVEGNAGIFVMSDLREHETYQGWVRMLGVCKMRVVHASLFAPGPFVARVSYEGHIYRISHLLPRRKVRDVTHSVNSNAMVFSIEVPEVKSLHAEAIRVG